LIEPFPESALNEQAGKMLLENYEEYARHARSVMPIKLSTPCCGRAPFYVKIVK
jgi:ubiquitin-protein ligase